jgi:hypothetical protein
MSPVGLDPSAAEPLSPADLALLRRLLDLLRVALDRPRDALAPGAHAAPHPAPGPRPPARMPCAAPLPGEPAWPSAPAPSRRGPPAPGCAR